MVGKGHACLAKPYSGAELARSIELVVQLVATGEAVKPYPRGFQVLAAKSRE